MTLNPAGQYVDDQNLRARQRLWEQRNPPFDTVGWVLDLAEIAPEMRVLDAGCGNGLHLRALAERRARATGCDLSPGMLAVAGHPAVACADVAALPARDGAFDAALAVHMLYHVPDRPAAVRELRRVLAPGGVCVAVTNGARHLQTVCDLTERAVRRVTPGWRMLPATHAFTAENAPAQLRASFRSVTLACPPVTQSLVLYDATLVADYVTSWAGIYQHETTRPWTDVAGDVRRQVQTIIDRHGAFTTSGDLAAFICR